MKKSFLMMAAILGISLSSLAQPSLGFDDDETEQTAQGKQKRTPEERAKMQSEKMKEKFGLNDNQTKQVYDAILARAQKVDAFKAKAPAEKKAGRAELKTANDECEAKFKEVMTADQYASYQKWKEEKKQKMMQKRGQGKRKQK